MADNENNVTDPGLDPGANAETEIFRLDGMEAKISSHDGKIVVELPEGLAPENAESFKKSIMDGSKLLSKLHKRTFESKRDNPGNEDLNSLRKELADLKASLAEPKKADPGAVPLYKELGLESESELREFAAQYPDAYLAKLNERSMAGTNQTIESLKQQTLITKAEAAGVDFTQLQNFAKHYGMPVNEKTLQLYQASNAPKTDPVIAAQIAAQQNQITFIEAQKRKGNYAGLSYKEMQQLPDDAINDIINMDM